MKKAVDENFISLLSAFWGLDRVWGTSNLINLKNLFVIIHRPKLSQDYLYRIERCVETAADGN